MMLIVCFNGVLYYLFPFIRYLPALLIKMSILDSFLFIVFAHSLIELIEAKSKQYTWSLGLKVIPISPPSSMLGKLLNPEHLLPWFCNMISDEIWSLIDLAAISPLLVSRHNKSMRAPRLARSNAVSFPIPELPPRIYWALLSTVLSKMVRSITFYIS